MKPLRKPIERADDEDRRAGRARSAARCRSRNWRPAAPPCAPIAGAKPTVDSSDRSNLPVMMISDSASTTSASAADEVRMVVMLAWRQEDRADQRADDDQHDQRRQEGEVAQARDRDACRWRRRRRVSATRRRARCVLITRHIPSIEATRALSLQPALCSATTPPWRMTSTRSQVRRSSSSPLTTRIALPSRAHALDDGEERLLRLDVDAGGRVHQHQDRGRRWRAPGPSRPSAGCRRRGSRPAAPGPSVTMPSVGDRCAASRRPCRRGAMKPSGPSWPAMVMVVLSATDCGSTRPCLCRLFGTQPTPSASAAGTSPRRQRRGR